MTWHASDVISIQQVTVVAVTASHVSFLNGITWKVGGAAKDSAAILLFKIL